MTIRAIMWRRYQAIDHRWLGEVNGIELFECMRWPRASRAQWNLCSFVPQFPMTWHRSLAAAKAAARKELERFVRAVVEE